RQGRWRAGRRPPGANVVLVSVIVRAGSERRSRTPDRPPARATVEAGGRRSLLPNGDNGAAPEARMRHGGRPGLGHGIGSVAPPAAFTTPPPTTTRTGPTRRGRTLWRAPHRLAYNPVTPGGTPNVPELPEVETVTRDLRPLLTGRSILAARRGSDVAL